MKDIYENCACLTTSGKCTRDARAEKKDGKYVLVGMQSCQVFDDRTKGCPYYYAINL